jgi:hypothetical protein
VLAASIFHYAEHAVADARRYLRDHGVPVRPVAAFGDGPQQPDHRGVEDR